MTWYRLLDHDSDVAEAVIERRVNELLRHHTGANDCRVVAETETMKPGYLVTRDDRLNRRLQAHTKVRIVRPTELWNSLDIHCAPARAMVPAPDNPLRAYDRVTTMEHRAGWDATFRCRRACPRTSQVGVLLGPPVVSAARPSAMGAVGLRVTRSPATSARRGRNTPAPGT